ncbi:DDE-domain-containing protein [Zopfia rhizophila CBS 207.26]|uniref:DDE-domain-containing protein n=1 Tax=Zopfia rhizophila CBS 207.26 TaxID=1314779 RepID=A0A6A6EL32_9PEZI|nr:DDE-domain-containing protein [Zopfia rhizophila CBS 207.26]
MAIIERISNVERKALRRWTFAQQPRPRQKAIIDWFEAEYGRKISQSTVSESLNDYFKYLDAEDLPTDESFRLRSANWPILEAILYEWQQRIENQGGLVSGALLAEKAEEIWHQIPAYQGQRKLEFSAGWVSRFKQRFGLKEVTQHGEQGSIPNTVFEEMEDVQKLCLRFAEEDIFNMDEIGLFWRWAISRGLATRSLPGVKKDKSRVSVMLCCNATGTQRLPPWVIGKLKAPRALRGVNILALGYWLSAFYSYIGCERKVLLLMDNFSAHITGLELQPPPPNITNFKSFYKKQWLRFNIECYNLGQSPFDHATILNVIRWIVRAWNVDVQNTTIVNCYIKSTCIPKRWQLSAASSTQDEDQIEDLYNEAARAGQIHDAMAIQNFLNPADEDLEQEEEFSLQDIIASHLGGGEQGEDEEEDETPPPPVPTASQALGAVRTLLHYQEYQENANYSDISYLTGLERTLAAVCIGGMRQTTLSGWLASTPNLD